MENESLNKKVTFQKVLLFLKGNCPTVFMKKMLNWNSPTCENQNRKRTQFQEKKSA